MQFAKQFQMSTNKHELSTMFLPFLCLYATRLIKRDTDTNEILVNIFGCNCSPISCLTLITAEYSNVKVGWKKKVGAILIFEIDLPL